MSVLKRAIAVISGFVALLAVFIFIAAMTAPDQGSGEGGRPGPSAIKGLYIGMPLEEAEQILSPYIVALREELDHEGVLKGRPLFEKKENMGELWSSNDWAIMMATLKGEVTSMTLYPQLVNKLFNTHDLPAEDFVQNFVNAYHIPLMEPHAESGVLGMVNAWWEYRDPQGVLITINQHKELSMDQVASAGDFAFD